MTLSQTPQVVTIDASEPVEKIHEIIARDGGVIVSNFFSPELLKETEDALKPWFDKRGVYKSKASHGELSEDFFPEGSSRIYGLLGKVPEPTIKVLRLPIWQSVMAKFLNDEYFSYVGDKHLPQKSGYMVAATAALRLVPGVQRQPLHKDHIPYQTRPDPNNPLFTPMVGCLVAGSKCTIKNGATAVIPGSHLWPDTRAPKVEECAYAEMEAGSALFILGSTYHGAGENKCTQEDPEAIRTLYAFAGQRDYFRQDQEEVLSTPVELARTFPEDILRLTGYYKSVGGVGYVEDHQDAAEYMFKK
ncbi:hypothetical protein B9479_002536 [Cryptococcus floricola]|uniref:Phytanoyl-CoA dioxygenase n=1 Tax=Cryptococcus floricola TaxID=2591691 RepID=A0A5D3B3D5_9TREE|nr:hypothetical protein B9479_002536 [Cryptococcus floricola]